MNQDSASKPQEKDVSTSDRLDFDLLEKNAEKNESLGENHVHYDWEYTEDGAKTRLFGDKKTGFIMQQTPPMPAFFMIYKEYHPNGILKSKGKRTGGGSASSKIGEWEYYDKNGKLTSKVDEDAKFGKFGYDELLRFLHEKGHINLETGENREGPECRYDAKTRRWYATTNSINGPNHYWMTSYTIDGETGEALEKNEYQGGIE